MNNSLPENTYKIIRFKIVSLKLIESKLQNEAFAKISVERKNGMENGIVNHY